MVHHFVVSVNSVAAWIHTLICLGVTTLAEGMLVLMVGRVSG